MSNLRHFVRNYPFSIICIALVWVLSLVPFFPETPLDNVEFIDKWVHIVMYGGTCSVIWFEYLRSHNVLNGWRLFLLAWLVPVLMSGCLELIQAYCTTNRSGEWLDFAANTVGATLGNIIGLLIHRLGKQRKYINIFV